MAFFRRNWRFFRKNPFPLIPYPFFGVLRLAVKSMTRFALDVNRFRDDVVKSLSAFRFGM